MSTMTKSELIEGIIDGTEIGQATVWLKWSKAKGWRVVRTPDGIVDETPVPDSLVDQSTADGGPDHYDDTLDAEAPDTDFDYYEGIIFRGVPGIESCAEADAWPK